MCSKFAKWPLTCAISSQNGLPAFASAHTRAHASPSRVRRGRHGHRNEPTHARKPHRYPTPTRNAPVSTQWPQRPCGAAWGHREGGRAGGCVGGVGKATLSRHQRGSNCSLRFSELGGFTENLRVCPEIRLTGQRRRAWAVFSTTGDNVALVAFWQRVESVRPYS